VEEGVEAKPLFSFATPLQQKKKIIVIAAS